MNRIYTKKVSFKAGDKIESSDIMEYLKANENVIREVVIEEFHIIEGGKDE